MRFTLGLWLSLSLNSSNRKAAKRKSCRPLDNKP
uniref:Uncharacterized protein n=1 Tax=Siphoviridae sp. ctA4S13 TaxID=2826179 RepID=A0A8S5MQX9_9CAUD|nr:MAG TPA: hypothetical protein [Siphoviridae sp. ctA4S13]